MTPASARRRDPPSSTGLRVLAIYRHYWPDTTPYARLLRAILTDAVVAGHSATVLTAQPSYNDADLPRQPAREHLDGVTIYRAPLLPERKQWRLVRLFNAGLFLWQALWHTVLRRSQYDVVLVNCHPPVLIGCLVRCLRHLTGLPYVLHYQDIHPEAGLLSGQIRPGWLARWLEASDTAVCRDAARIVTLSEDMRRTLESRRGFPRDVPLTIINNFPLDTFGAADKLPATFEDGPRGQRPFRVLFAGNIGLFQQLDDVVEAAHLLQHEAGIEFVFLGSGAAVGHLRRQARELVTRTVRFVPQQSVEVAIACMERSDLGVVSLTPGVERVAYPSKTMTYLAAGLPVLAHVPFSSCLAADIEQHGLGYVSGGTGGPALAAAILRAKNDRSRWTAPARDELRARCTTRFGRRQALDRWAALWRGLAAEIQAAPFSCSQLSSPPEKVGVQSLCTAHQIVANP
jgi:colanic acid biosynthesis glycosyl transferase WcaI